MPSVATMAEWLRRWTWIHCFERIHWGFLSQVRILFVAFVLLSFCSCLFFVRHRRRAGKKVNLRPKKWKNQVSILFLRQFLGQKELASFESVLLRSFCYLFVFSFFFVRDRRRASKKVDLRIHLKIGWLKILNVWIMIMSNRCVFARDLLQYRFKKKKGAFQAS